MEKISKGPEVPEVIEPKTARKRPATKGQDKGQTKEKDKQKYKKIHKEPEVKPDMHDAACADMSEDDTLPASPVEIPNLEDDEKQQQQKFVRLTLRPGHGNKMTVLAIGQGGNDKAQIIEVSGSMCAASGVSPTIVCTKIIELIKGIACDSLGGPEGVAKATELPLVRQLAREHRAELLKK